MADKPNRQEIEEWVREGVTKAFEEAGVQTKGSEEIEAIVKEFTDKYGNEVFPEFYKKLENN